MNGLMNGLNGMNGLQGASLEVLRFDLNLIVRFDSIHSNQNNQTLRKESRTKRVEMHSVQYKVHSTKYKVHSS